MSSNGNIIQETKDKEAIKEYYLFLYDLVTEKNYEHSSQLTGEEREYCEKLLSRTQSSQHRSNELYLSLVEDIFKEALRRKSKH